MPDAASLSTVPPQPTRPSGPQRAVGPAVRRLLDSPDPAREAERLWSTLDHTPLTESDPDDPDAAIVTFLWRGGDEVAEVLLVANKLTDASTYETSRFDRVDGTDVWHLGLRMRRDWRGSYALAVVPSGACEPTLPRDRLTGLERRRERSLAVTPPERHTSIRRWYDALRYSRADPLAAETLDAWSSVASLPEAPPQPWLAPDPTTPRGQLFARTLSDDALGRDVRYWVHIPAVAPPPEGLSVLVLLDGHEWLEQGVTTTLDNLVAHGRIRPMLTVLVDNGDTPTRVRELTCNPDFVTALVERLLPEATRGQPVATDPARHLIAGQSLGGLTALYAALQRPDRFGAVICQSGSWWWSGPDGDSPEWLTGQVASAARLPGRMYLEVGLGEWVLLDRTRRLYAVLADRVPHLTYREYNGGHDRACWRGSLADALIAVGGDTTS